MNRFQVLDKSCVVVVVPLTVSDVETLKLHDCLDSDEKIRADRYVTQELRRRFITCRGRLRMLLGKILAISPDQVELEYGIRGKPYLACDTDLQFNVSHSQDCALMAFARGSSVGIDLEMIDRRLNEEAIASQLLSAEDISKWLGLPETGRRETLLSLWVAKEAVLKSIGVGIAASLKKLVLPIPLPMDGCSLTLDPDLLDMADVGFGVTRAASNFNREWRLQFINELPHAKAAVCFEQQIELSRICCWEELES